MGKNKASAKKKKEKSDISTLIDRVSSARHNETIRFTIGIVIVAVTLFAGIACLSFIFTGGVDQSLVESVNDNTAEAANSAGSFGAVISQNIINKWFGLPSFLLLYLTFVIGCNMMRITHARIGRKLVSCIFLTVWLSILFSLILTPLFDESFLVPGGNHGLNVCNWLDRTIGLPGIILLLLLTMLFYCIWLTRRTIEWIRDKFNFVHRSASADSVNDSDSNGQTTQPDNEEDEADSEAETDDNAENFQISDRLSDNLSTQDEEDTTGCIHQDITGNNPENDDDTPEDDDSRGSDNEIELEIVHTTPEDEYSGNLSEPYNPRLDLSHYKFPTPDLLNQYNETGPSDNKDEQQANKNKIINVLRSFGIEITSISATPGPTVTLYEITPAEGIRISKIRNLEDDIALSLAAYGIRIIAPIPGKGTIGIEVPNANPVMVPMQSVVRSRKFVESTYELPVALGKTITNELFMFDLAKMPHLLVAGATGMGKSVGLNAIVTSLLYKKHPAEMKLVMVDPKMVEFSIYASIEKHFLAKLPDENEAIITDPTKVVHTLKSLCTEMDSRYELLKEANVRSIIEYNKLFIDRKLNPLKGHRYLPYIVVVIDEFGDLIMTAGKEIETPICRIAQKARAVGMHMIIATQRPTTNIITGTIKANFPARIAFRVTSMIDSRTILDCPGANQLIGRGDMLFSQGGDPKRIQCAFVDTPEVQNICNYINKQQGYVTAYELPEYVDENDDSNGGGEAFTKGELDPIFEDAARLIVGSQQGSTSLIQRKFKIGYNRAGRIMDQLERAGIVSRQEGSKPRQVLCMDDMELDQKLQNLQ